MSRETTELLKAFEALPAGEKEAFAVEILRRTRTLQFDSGPLDDSEIGEAGRALLAMLDQEEDDARPR